jgi:hypothetical protein
MSQINFANLISERPDLALAWGNLAEWLQQRPNVRFIDVDRVATELPFLPADELAAAFEELAARHLAERVFRVEDPRGVQTPAEFHSVSDIPEYLTDTWGRDTFPVREGRILPGFRLQGRTDVFAR